MALIRPKLPHQPAPDMLPVVDVVFQLLLFLIVVVGFENTRAEERLRLPKNLLAKPPAASQVERWVLTMGFDRDLTGRKLNDEPFVVSADNKATLSNVGPLLEQERRLIEAKWGRDGVDQTTVVLKADSDVPTGKVQELIRKCQELGLTQFSLQGMPGGQHGQPVPVDSGRSS